MVVSRCGAAKPLVLCFLARSCWQPCYLCSEVTQSLSTCPLSIPADLCGVAVLQHINLPYSHLFQLSCSKVTQPVSPMLLLSVKRPIQTLTPAPRPLPSASSNAQAGQHAWLPPCVHLTLCPSTPSASSPCILPMSLHPPPGPSWTTRCSGCHASSASLRPTTAGPRPAPWRGRCWGMAAVA